jgi:thioredoxin 1
MGFFRDDFPILTPETFLQEVLQDPGPVLVLFYQSWDKPSKMQSTELEYLQQKHPGLKICKVNGVDYPELLQQYHILMMPTTICFAGGKSVRRATGLRTKETLERLLPPDYKEDTARTVQAVTAATFDAEVLQADGTVLVLFYGDQQSSRMELAELQSLLNKQGGFKACKVDCEEDAALAGRYNILLPPTTVAYRQGRPIRRATGLRSLEELKRLLEM